jgi:hypothetical protein
MASAPSARVWLVDDTGAHDVFEVEAVTEGLVRARSPFLFEVGEELRLRIEQGGTTTDATARVRGHVGGVTELELTDRAATPRRTGAGAG